ncbi:hypothetical protein BRC65_07885 [Halobacteriales archaeon QH_2_65_14]|nr:MAG: hypothetical protein BRC65_07885 [Halobacteriales archaeon QH_2_65_14]
MRRAFATILTLSILTTFLFVVVLGLMLAFGVVSLPLAVGLVVLVQVGLLLVGPTVNDFLYGCTPRNRRVRRF